MGVAAELGGDAGVGLRGEVGGHDGDGAAEEAEGGRGHALVLDLEEPGQAAALGFAENFEGVFGAGFEIEAGVGAAGELLAGADAEGVAFGLREGKGHKEGSGYRAQGPVSCYWMLHA